MTIASIDDGRVVPWYLTAAEIPIKYVEIPDALLEKYRSGEIADGRELARQALALNAPVGTAPSNTFVPPKAAPKKEKSAAAKKDADDERPRTVKV